MRNLLILMTAELAGVRLPRISAVEAWIELKKKRVADFSVGFCSRSSDPLSFHQLLPLGINTQLVWIPALLKCNISTLQHIFIYFWKLCCSFCFGYRLLLSYYSCWYWTAFFTFIGTLWDTAHYRICRAWSREKAACWTS